MAVEQNKIEGTLNDNEDSADVLQVQEGGVIVLDAIQTGTSLVVSVQVSLDNSTFKQAYDDGGNALSETVTVSMHKEWVAQPGLYYKLVGTSNSSGDVDYRMSRVKVG